MRQGKEEGVGEGKGRVRPGEEGVGRAAGASPGVCGLCLPLLPLPPAPALLPGSCPALETGEAQHTTSH